MAVVMAGKADVAFHARNRRSSRTTRESSRESVFGLAGWLFADLLLALSVVFLVAQDRPSQETDKDAKIVELEEIIKEKNSAIDELEEIIKEKNSTIDELSDRVAALEEICDANGCAEASGLSPGEQLIIEIPGGAARGMTVDKMRTALDRAALTVEEVDTKKKTPTSWDRLIEQNRRIGFVIFFTRDSVQVQSQAERNLDELVQALVKEGLVDPDLQLEKSGGSYRFDVFPNLTRYSDDFVRGDNLRIRALMFTYTSPLTGTTTTTVEE